MDSLLNINSFKIKKKKKIINKDNLIDFKFFIPTKHFLKYVDNKEPRVKVPLNQQNNYPYARKIIIGNLPQKTLFSTDDLINFLDLSLKNAHLNFEDGYPIINYFYQEEQRFIVIELRSIEETNVLYILNGWVYKNKSLRFRRPIEYYKKQRVEGERKIPYINFKNYNIRKISSNCDGQNKIKIENIPSEIEEEFVWDLMNKYGIVKSFEYHYHREKKFNLCYFQYYKPESFFNINKLQLIINGYTLRFLSSKYNREEQNITKIHYNFMNYKIQFDNKKLFINKNIKYSKCLKLKLTTDKNFKEFSEKFGVIDEFTQEKSIVRIKYNRIEASILLYSYLNSIYNKVKIEFLN